jgi:AraC-like DNA-binding protein
MTVRRIMKIPAEFHFGALPRIEAWRVETLGYDHPHDAYAHHESVLASVRVSELCGLPFADASTSLVSRAKRTLVDARRDGMDDYKLLFQLDGKSTIIQGDDIDEIATGDIGLLDVSRPIDLVPRSESGRWIGLHFPRKSLVSQLGFEPQAGLCWRGDALPTRLLFRLLRDAIDDGSAALGPGESDVQLAIYHLVGAMFGASAPDGSGLLSQADKLFQRVRGIVKRHLSDPDVGPVEVAAEAGISVRYLQKLFAARGTTYGYFVRSMRLDHATRLLDGRAGTATKLPLAAVAYACGYRDYAHFARNFRARFGHTPGSFQDRARLQ